MKNNNLFEKSIINGLGVNYTNEKIKQNCDLLNIDLPKKGLNNIKISRRGNLSVITIIIDSEKLIQYIIFNNLSLNELNYLPKHILNDYLKQIIIQILNLNKVETLNDYLNWKNQLIKT